MLMRQAPLAPNPICLVRKCRGLRGSVRNRVQVLVLSQGCVGQIEIEPRFMDPCAESHVFTAITTVGLHIQPGYREDERALFPIALSRETLTLRTIHIVNQMWQTVNVARALGSDRSQDNASNHA